MLPQGKKLDENPKMREFCSTNGLDSHDVAVASKVYKRALEKGIGLNTTFGVKYYLERKMFKIG